jgi:hypothetical protein
MSDACTLRIAAADVARRAVAFAFRSVVWFGVGVPVGILLLLICIAALGVVMLREAGQSAALGAPAAA